MSDIDYMPKWCQQLVKWTSPAWYLFLVYTLLMLIGICIYVACATDDE